MDNLRAFVGEQCRIISDGIQEEADHWREIHAMLQQYCLSVAPIASVDLDRSL